MNFDYFVIPSKKNKSRVQRITGKEKKMGYIWWPSYDTLLHQKNKINTKSRFIQIGLQKIYTKFLVISWKSENVFTFISRPLISREMIPFLRGRIEYHFDSDCLLRPSTLLALHQASIGVRWSHIFLEKKMQPNCHF